LFPPFLYFLGCDRPRLSVFLLMPCRVSLSPCALCGRPVSINPRGCRGKPGYAHDFRFVPASGVDRARSALGVVGIRGAEIPSPTMPAPGSRECPGCCKTGKGLGRVHRIAGWRGKKAGPEGTRDKT